MPTCFHFPSQNPPKWLPTSILEGFKILIQVGTDFLTVQNRFSRPRRRQEGAKRAPRAPKSADPRRTPRALRRPKTAPRPQEGPQAPQGGPYPLSEADFSNIKRCFGPLLARFGHPTWPSQPTKIFEKSFPTRPRFLIPTCLHFTSQNMSKTFQKSI